MNIAIYGYGNLGKGVEAAILQNSDCSLAGIYTRRNPDTVRSVTGTSALVPAQVPVYAAESIYEHKDKIDVVIVCGGSATDLPVITPRLAKDFNVVDSFDTHAKIPQHFNAVNQASTAGGKISLISTGWDPGLFSLARLYASSVLPNGNDYTFWGRGVSQGHSDAIRRVEGVLDARQYTVPIDRAVACVKNGQNPVLTAREKHKRECYVVAKEGADLAEIERKIKSMPDYFADYDTTVTFVTAEELKTDHSGLPHGGEVIRTGKTGVENNHSQTVCFSLKLDSNPEFTGSVLVACARAIYKMSQRGVTGCKTVFDLAPADLSPLSPEEIRRTML